MLSKERIKEAEYNVKQYLREGLLKKTEADTRVADVLLRNSRESVELARITHEKKISDLWVIVCSYYAMYYYACAVLLRMGYKVGDKIVHKVTSDSLITYARGKLKDALIEEYEETQEEALSLAGIKADNLIESFDYERNKRSAIQYQTNDADKKAKAGTSLQRAKEFIFEMEKLMHKLK